MDNIGKIDIKKARARLALIKKNVLSKLPPKAQKFITGKAGEIAQKIISLTKDFMWFVSDECKKIRGLEIDPKQDTLSEIFN